MTSRRLTLQSLPLLAAMPGYAQRLPSLESGLSLRPDVAVPMSYVGMHVHDILKTWPPFPFGRLRLWDTRTTWSNLQPAPDRWDFDRLDRIVEKVNSRGIGVVICLGMPPRWAASRPDEPSPYGPSGLGAASEPRSLKEWAQYVRTVAERYRGKVRHYELWNEVNAGTGFYTGSPEALLELQRSAYDVLKSVDPTCVFIAPSSVGESEGQLGWFERYMKLLNGRYADVISYHLYTPRKAPEAMLPLIARLREICSKTGNGALPLWNSESGYRVNWGQKNEPGGTMNTWPNLSPDVAAAWWVRSLVVGWAAGLEASFSYAFDNGFMGMVGPGMATSPVTEAASLAIARLVGSRVTRLAQTTGVWIASMERSGVSTSLVWTGDDGGRIWVPPAGLKARFAATLDGTPLAASGGGFAIGAMPILVADDQASLRLPGTN